MIKSCRPLEVLNQFRFLGNCPPTVPLKSKLTLETRDSILASRSLNTLSFEMRGSSLKTTQEQWKVEKNCGCILCTSDINTFVSSMSCFVVVYFLKAITNMYLAFSSKKQVSKGLLTGDQKRIFSLSKCKLHLHESERVSPNAWSHVL